MNDENLTNNFKNKTPEERHAYAVKAGKASGVTRRKKRDLKMVVKALLDENVTNKKGVTLTRREAMAVNLLNKAISGDVKAVKLVAELANEMPAQKMELEHVKVVKPQICFRDPEEETDGE